MKTSTPIVTLLAASTSLVSAGKVRRSPRHLRRQTVKETTTYGGIGLTPSPDGSVYSYITAAINIPQTKYVSEHSTPPTIQRAAAWVGFGPNPGTSAKSGASGLMQTGCVMYNDGQGDQYPRCWYEFYPSPPVFFSGFQPAIGDTVQLELWRNSATQATAKITDLTNGAVVSGTFSAPSGHSEAGQNAEWVVEDPGDAPLVDFGNFYFTSCSATTADGNSYHPTDGQYNVFYEYYSGMEQDYPSIPGGSGFSVQYTGLAGTS